MARGTERDPVVFSPTCPHYVRGAATVQGLPPPPATLAFTETAWGEGKVIHLTQALIFPILIMKEIEAERGK